MSPGRSGIKVTASDALEFEPVTVVKPKGRRRLILFSLAVVLGGTSIGWYTYGERLIQLIGDQAAPIPVVRAVAGPVKVRPKDPGGKWIPDRDKSVYDLIDETTGEARVEQLLPPPETPLPKPGPTTLKTQSKRADATGTSSPSPRLTLGAKPKTTAKVPTENDVAAIKPPVPAPVAPASSEPAKETAVISEQQPTIQAKPVETAAQAAIKSPPRTPKVAVKSAKSVMQPAQAVVSPSRPPARSMYRAQLAAARSADAAEREWVRLRAKNLDLLGNLGLTITKVDLGANKGVFYRLRVGPLSDEEKARELCGALAKRRVACLVIKPDG